jgi:hypothetical protein
MHTWIVEIRDLNGKWNPYQLEYSKYNANAAASELMRISKDHAFRVRKYTRCVTKSAK